MRILPIGRSLPQAVSKLAWTFPFRLVFAKAVRSSASSSSVDVSIALQIGKTPCSGTFATNNDLPKNPQFKASSAILKELFEKGCFDNDEYDTTPLVAKSIIKEIQSQDISEKANQFLTLEKIRNYPEVAQKGKVITTETVTVLIQEKSDTINRLENYEKVSPQEIQENSVQIYYNPKKFRQQDITPLNNHPNIYCWRHPYEADFLGYMKGVLKMQPEHSETYML